MHPSGHHRKGDIGQHCRADKVDQVAANGKIGDPVLPLTRAEFEQIGPGPTRQPVSQRTAAQQVSLCPAIQRVIALPAIQRISARLPGQAVTAQSTVSRLARSLPVSVSPKVPPMRFSKSHIEIPPDPMV